MQLGSCELHTHNIISIHVFIHTLIEIAISMYFLFSFIHTLVLGLEIIALHSV